VGLALALGLADMLALAEALALGLADALSAGLADMLALGLADMLALADTLALALADALGTGLQLPAGESCCTFPLATTVPRRNDTAPTAASRTARNGRTLPGSRPFPGGRGRGWIRCILAPP
jgi:hypothetical protein